MKYIKLLIVHCSLLICASAHAYNFDLSGFGTAGMIDPDFEHPNFIGDWRVRGQFDFGVTDDMKMGAVYAMDQRALDSEKYARDAFAFIEYADIGRAEIGYTDSVVRKLGLGLPDVGGLRVNDRPIFYKKIPPRGAVISDTVLHSGRYDPRLNLVTAPGALQYGLSVSGLTHTYDYGLDFGMKYRHPAGKTKTSVYWGVSYIDNPNGFGVDAHLPDVTADWRGQFAAGANVQYNSWIFGATFRAIYDENAVGEYTDGLHAGIGASYDLLKYSISASYLFSDTGVWEKQSMITHSGILSLRYKYSKNLDLWMSGGITGDTPFVSVALRVTF